MTRGWSCTVTTWLPPMPGPADSSSRAGRKGRHKRRARYPELTEQVNVADMPVLDDVAPAEQSAARLPVLDEEADDPERLNG